MPVAKPVSNRRSSVKKLRGVARVAATKLPPLKKPSTPYPGYMTDEWHQYGMEIIRRTTKEEFLADLLRFGIIDKKGRYTKPYRNA
jgi:hypothetical protein